MTIITKEQISLKLKSITLPLMNQNIVDAGIVSSIVIRESGVGFAIEVDKIIGTTAAILKQQCEIALGDIPATIILTSSNKQIESKQKTSLPFKNIIAIAAGKGGVGKSTVALGIALNLAQHYRVGIVDADIYGPSIPKMLGIKEKPEISGNKLTPVLSHNLKVLSTAMLIESEETALIWRGPMTTKALAQLINANWGELDVLIIDMPPGTGDIHLSLTENYNITGSVIVTTPGEIAVQDVKKAITSIKRMNVPIFGVVENMSYFVSEQGKNHYIFGKGGGAKLAADNGLELLGEIELIENLCDLTHIENLYMEITNQIKSKLWN